MNKVWHHNKGERS